MMNIAVFDHFVDFDLRQSFFDPFALVLVENVQFAASLKEKYIKNSEI